jgi:hypothetical protein
MKKKEYNTNKNNKSAVELCSKQYNKRIRINILSITAKTQTTDKI